MRMRDEVDKHAKKREIQINIRKKRTKNKIKKKATKKINDGKMPSPLCITIETSTCTTIRGNTMSVFDVVVAQSPRKDKETHFASLS